MLTEREELCLLQTRVEMELFSYSIQIINNVEARSKHHPISTEERERQVKEVAEKIILLCNGGEL